MFKNTRFEAHVKIHSILHHDFMTPFLSFDINGISTPRKMIDYIHNSMRY